MSITALEQSVLDLCSISSFTGEEGPLCDVVERELVALFGRDVVGRDGHSLVVVPNARNTVSSDAPHVVLAGHLDVVRTEHDGPPRIDGDKIYGPGAADMKSGLAIMLEILRSMARGESVNKRVSFVFYEREEGPYLENRLGDVLQHFPSLTKADVAVCLEPSLNVLQLGCMGSLHATVTFRGKTSHSARPWQGVNAIHKASGFLQRLEARGFREVVIDEMPYREVMSATMAKGGRGRNVIPDAFELNVNVRFVPGMTSEQAEQALREVIQDDAECEVIDRSPSALPARSHPLVRELEQMGVEGVEPKQAWTDVARFASVGVAAVNLGPGTQSQAHQKNEWTDRAALARGETLFRKWLGMPTR